MNNDDNEEKGKGEWLAVFCHWGATESERRRTKAEAISFLQYGEDNGDLYALATYEIRTGRIWMQDALGVTDKEKLRSKIKVLLNL